MNEKQIQRELDAIEAVQFGNPDAYWMVKAQLITALAIAQLDNSLCNALPLAGKGN